MPSFYEHASPTILRTLYTTVQIKRMIQSSVRNSTVYQEPHFWRTEGQELLHLCVTKLFRRLNPLQRNFWNLWVDLTYHSICMRYPHSFTFGIRNPCVGSTSRSLRLAPIIVVVVVFVLYYSLYSWVHAIYVFFVFWHKFYHTKKNVMSAVPTAKKRFWSRKPDRPTPARIRLSVSRTKAIFRG